MINRKTFYKNENVYGFNCGGFALGSMTWYVPSGWENAREKYCDRCRELNISRYGDNTNVVNEFVREVAESIVKDTKNVVRILETEEDKKPFEELVYFRITYDFGDFHFVALSGETYYHKKGTTPSLEIMGEEEFFSEDGWCSSRGNPYTSNMIILAKPKRPLYKVYKIMPYQLGERKDDFWFW